jgi:hypothetical protein
MSFVAKMKSFDYMGFAKQHQKELAAGGLVVLLIIILSATLSKKQGGDLSYNQMFDALVTKAKAAVASPSQGQEKYRYLGQSKSRQGYASSTAFEVDSATQDNTLTYNNPRVPRAQGANKDMINNLGLDGTDIATIYGNKYDASKTQTPDVPDMRVAAPVFMRNTDDDAQLLSTVYGPAFVAPPAPAV